MNYSPNFLHSLIAAGVGGLPFSWAEDGTFWFDASVTPEQRAIIEQVAATDLATPYLPVLIASKLKFRKALNQLGLRETVEAAVAASTDQDLKDAWLLADEYHSDDLLVIALGTALGKTTQEIIDVFKLAATL